MPTPPPTLDELFAACAAEVAAEDAAALACLPADLAARLRALKVAAPLVHALHCMATAAWRSQLDMADARASALTIAALTYGDLAAADYDALTAYLRDLYRARGEFLAELADDGRRHDV